jgi:glutamate-1-semialdehyde aminotransferase
MHRRVLEAGTWMAPSAYEVAFLSLAHTEAHVDRAVAALAAALAQDQERTASAS